MFGRIQSWSIWNLSVLCGKIFNYKFNFFSRYKSVQIIDFFLDEFW